MRPDFAIHPAFASRLAALGIDSPERVLDLPGEVVSGHPDRHVLRVQLPGFSDAFYLKRQHLVSRRERFRNWRAGFGWVSRSERERSILAQLAESGIPAPRWVAAGEDDRGRAFLLVEEIANASDLHSTLRSTESSSERAELAGVIGSLIDHFHRRGFTTPDLTAKHLLVSADTVAPIDWQNARLVARVSIAERVRTLASLHASVSPNLATPRERLRVLHTALRSARREGLIADSLSVLVRRVAIEAKRLSSRRSIRDQNIASPVHQRLVWVAGEAVCAIPEVAEVWPAPAIGPPFYDVEPGSITIHLPDGRRGHLIRGRSINPVGRVRHWVRGKSWRSAGAITGRILFHLERHAVPAPRLLAFGQRLTGRASAEWFALHTPPARSITIVTHEIAEELGQCLRQLHEAGCRPVADPRLVFGVVECVCVRDVTALRLVKSVSRRDRLDDLSRLASSLPHHLRALVRVGYATIDGADTPPTEEPITAGVSG